MLGGKYCVFIYEIISIFTKDPNPIDLIPKTKFFFTGGGIFCYK